MTCLRRLLPSILAGGGAASLVRRAVDAGWHLCDEQRRSERFKPLMERWTRMAFQPALVRSLHSFPPTFSDFFFSLCNLQSTAMK